MTPHQTRVVFMGSPAFAVPSLHALVAAGYHLVAVYAQPDRPAGRGRQLTPPPVKAAAQALGVPVYQPERLRGAEATAALRSLRAEIIVVAAYGQILRPAVIDLPPLGCLNVHASLLPRHRGASCVAAAILAGDAETGATIMRIDTGMDTGPLVAERSTPITDDDTSASLTDRLSNLGAELLVETLPDWIGGAIAALPQEEALATYAPLLDKSDGAIDWQKPAIRLWHEVRAFNPWPLSTAWIGSESLQIMEAWPLSDSSEVKLPGMVISLDGIASALPEQARRRAGFAVATGEGLLVPLTVRRQGRPAATAAEFARGARGLIGSTLG